VNATDGLAARVRARDTRASQEEIHTPVDAARESRARPPEARALTAHLTSSRLASPLARAAQRRAAPRQAAPLFLYLSRSRGARGEV